MYLDHPDDQKLSPTVVGYLPPLRIGDYHIVSQLSGNFFFVSLINFDNVKNEIHLTKCSNVVSVLTNTYFRLQNK